MHGLSGGLDVLAAVPFVPHTLGRIGAHSRHHVLVRRFRRRALLSRPPSREYYISLSLAYLVDVVVVVKCACTLLRSHLVFFVVVVVPSLEWLRWFGRGNRHAVINGHR